MATEVRDAVFVGHPKERFAVTLGPALVAMICILVAGPQSRCRFLEQ